MLVVLPEAEESSVVEEMVKPHIEAARENGAEPGAKKRLEVIEDTLIQV